MPNIEHHLLPNGVTVDYKDDTHQYFVSGVEKPSITSLIRKVYGDHYAGADPEILERAAKYGTAVHNELKNLIEMRRENSDIPLVSEYQEVQNYFTYVEPIYKIEPLFNEKVVALYDDLNNIVACGRIDMYCLQDGQETLIDFKTTSTILKPQVTAQLNLYRLALKQSGYIDSDDIKLGVIHLSGEKAKFVPIVKLNNKFYLTFIK